MPGFRLVWLCHEINCFTLSTSSVSSLDHPGSPWAGSLSSTMNSRATWASSEPSHVDVDYDWKRCFETMSESVWCNLVYLVLKIDCKHTKKILQNNCRSLRIWRCSTANPQNLGWRKATGSPTKADIHQWSNEESCLRFFPSESISLGLILHLPNDSKSQGKGCSRRVKLQPNDLNQSVEMHVSASNALTSLVRPTTILGLSNHG